MEDSLAAEANCIPPPPKPLNNGIIVTLLLLLLLLSRRRSVSRNDHGRAAIVGLNRNNNNIEWRFDEEVADGQ